MKRIVLLLALGIAASGYAQNPSKFLFPPMHEKSQNMLNPKNKKNDEHPKKHAETHAAAVPSIYDWAQRRINDINQQIDSLRNEIDKEYQKYITQDSLLAQIESETDSLRIDTVPPPAQTKVVKKKVRHKEIDIDTGRLSAYYNTNSIDTLFAHADLESLKFHKQMLGEGYPKVMDTLQLLLECRQLLSQKFDAGKNSAGLRQLESVQDCGTKARLEKLLHYYKDLTDEVDYWVRKEAHTLYSMTVFYNRLNEYYGDDIILNTDFPYLDKIVRDKVKENMTQNPAKNN